jgi:hypothetical protein
LDLSSSDLKLSGESSNARELYSSLLEAKNKYLGFSIHQSILNDLLNQVFVRLHDFDTYRLWDALPENDYDLSGLKLGQVEIFIPELLDEYPFDKLVQLRVNPT